MKLQINKTPKTPARAPVAPVPHRPPRPDAGRATGAVVAALGWVATLVLAVALLVTFFLGRSAQEAARIRVAADYRAVQGEVQVRQEQYNKKHEELVDQLNALIEVENKLTKDISLVRAECTDLKAVAEETRTRAARTKSSASAVTENVTMLGEDREELQGRVDKLQAARTELVQTYTEYYNRMKAAYDQKLARPEPEVMRQFYSSHQNTPFAPAACYAAAEKLYEAKRSVDAERLLEELVRKYGDSTYAARAQQRLAAIKAHEPYRKDDARFVPYKAPAFVH